VTNPRLVVCDEAVSALDVTFRGQILELLEPLQEDFDPTYLFISLDLIVIRHICDRIVVIYVEKIAEVADALDLYTAPLHPHPEALMAAVPVSDPRLRDRRGRVRLMGEVADSSNPQTGCHFHPRCPYAQNRCRSDPPPLRLIGPGRSVSCHFAE
jgi:peptide/nickel transport system ATP-binding protein